MSLIRFKARALIGAAIAADGIDVLRSPEPHREVAESVLACPALNRLAESAGRTVSPAQAVRAAAIGQTAGGALIATSLAPRLGALASLAATVPATLAGYRFWQIKDDDEARARLRAGFLFRLLVIGADLLVLAGPTGRSKRRAAKAAKAAKKAARRA
ncbi:MAG: DoxX family membrane protein [Bifidobacteriaceae bacterium]|jgi:uncharacterized membrane protein YphA (DoxX/SURF4 family)|nr:DoxX family membrane protein [Bifidobacteriaceae bacterium]